MSEEKLPDGPLEVALDDEKRLYDHHEDSVDQEQISHVKERQLVRKIDLHLVPVLCVLYLLAFLDRVNVSNAALFSLKQDLKLVGNEYNTALVIFFVPYVVFEIPSNMLMKRFKPHVWLSFCMFMFGLTTMLQGFAQNFSGFIAARFFLGAWYKRSESQKRYSFFFSSTTLAGAFGGLLASAIGKMDGMRGYHGWRWVFILEGLFTAILGIIFFFLISDFPEEVKWLTPDERKIIIGGFMYLGLVVTAYGYAYFAPAIIQGLGHSNIRTQLLSVPPWACAFGLSMIIAVLSDYLAHRFIFALIPAAISLAGFAILFVVHDNVHLQYAALFLAVAGTYASLPVIVCWFSANLGGHARRAVGTGWQIGFGNIGGIIAAYSFLAKDAPEYRSGFSICVSFICLTMSCCCVYFLYITYLNRQRDRKEADGIELSWEDKRELGDLSPDYRYLR
ncbi:hypothetical protein NM688_g4063 [Phlebia brevispora]|uniref:Uncharacterized protein n=1 Tax=Phlebia brevispora TaxID=194682 RepID=A0ACC1T4D5_9APHY|nr:hypothetical protein NM688_g4063 [Phlebia brevispora]